ncbi:hypothetical protein P170DRAFT_377315 [Aspergillus steynii IBT 23096]|uniref:Uncharacterized protein n=1 Tax=Aspergillus steynii IBT 23096 TaxID=1392250 RepID=A0A2I2GGD5_9EURO|nr:uncharacterized protein P170DRAFT_377315 [Aspergillus steynii IBT 23096]PLB51944.1 hypothetical protein P170DRAFT_377315 [Aspergillus steynii IBT 23096]
MRWLESDRHGMADSEPCKEVVSVKLFCLLINLLGSGWFLFLYLLFPLFLALPSLSSRFPDPRFLDRLNQIAVPKINR